MDSILSVRINEEVKERFLQMASEEGINNKDFLDLIIKSYEMNKIADNSIDFVKNDIDELQSILKRILDIYINIIDKNKLKFIESENNHKFILNEIQTKTDKVSLELENSKKKYDELTSENEKLRNQIQILNNKLSKEKENLKEFKDMNSILKDKLCEFNNYKIQLEKLIETNTNLNSKLSLLEKDNENLLSEIKEYKSSNNILLNKLKDEESRYKISIKELEDSFTSKISLKESEFNLILQKSLLDKEQELRKEIWNIKLDYDKKISNLIKEKEILLLKISNTSNDK